MANRRNGPPGGKWNRAEAAARAKAGWEARVGGASWATIAEECGYSSASHACRSVTNFAGGLPAIDVEAMRAAAIERGEALWREAWEDVVARRPGAVTAAVRVLGRQAALVGLDAPGEIVLHTPTTAELERWVAGVLASQTASTPIEFDVIAGELGPGPDELAPVE